MRAWGRPAPFGLAGRKHVHEGLQVVPVDGAHVPAEGRELGAQVARIAHLARAAVDLQAVAVHDGGQVVQTAMGSEHGRLPHLAFLALAVAQKREHGAAVPVRAPGRRRSRRRWRAPAPTTRWTLPRRAAGWAVRDGPAGACPACARSKALRAGSSLPVRALRREPAPHGLSPRKNRSRPAFCGSAGSCSSTPPKYSAARMSAHDSDPPGWPLPASAIMLTMSRRISLARRSSSVIAILSLPRSFDCAPAALRSG